jgi:hypothetical protein
MIGMNVRIVIATSRLRLTCAARQTATQGCAERLRPSGHDRACFDGAAHRNRIRKRHHAAAASEDADARRACPANVRQRRYSGRKRRERKSGRMINGEMQCDRSNSLFSSWKSTGFRPVNCPLGSQETPVIDKNPLRRRAHGQRWRLRAYASGARRRLSHGLARTLLILTGDAGEHALIES